MRLLGIDVGISRVGLAISDELAITCSPLGFVLRERAVAEIARIVEEQKVDKIIVGIPLLADGKKGGQAGDVEAFSTELASATDIPLEFENEHLSSVAAEERLRAEKKRPEKGMIDAMAACIILESFIGENNL